MFVLDDFWDKSPSWFMKNLKLLMFYWHNFKIFQNALRQYIPNSPPKYVVTDTYGHSCLLLFLQRIFEPGNCKENVRIWSFSCIWTECGDLICKSQYSVRILENTNKERDFGGWSSSEILFFGNKLCIIEVAINYASYR